MDKIFALIRRLNALTDSEEVPKEMPGVTLMFSAGLAPDQINDRFFIHCGSHEVLEGEGAPLFTEKEALESMLDEIEAQAEAWKYAQSVVERALKDYE